MFGCSLFGLPLIANSFVDCLVFQNASMVAILKVRGAAFISDGSQYIPGGEPSNMWFFVVKDLPTLMESITPFMMAGSTYRLVILWLIVTCFHADMLLDEAKRDSSFW